MSSGLPDPYIVLDELFNHLDKESSKMVAAHIQKFSQNNITIIFTGHEFELDHNICCEVEQWKS